MCQQIIKYCVGSMRPLLLAGSFLILLLGLFLAGNCYYANDLYSVIDFNDHWSSKIFWAQLVASFYLILLTFAGCFSAYYEHKEAIRALAIISIVNVVLAISAVVFLPHASTVSNDLEPTLKAAQEKYNFSDSNDLPMANVIDSTILNRIVNSDNNNNQTTTTMANSRPARQSGQESSSSPPAKKELDSATATKMWDYLQISKYCCGLVDGNKEWKGKIPKSCCSKPKDTEQVNKERYCEKVDSDHNRGCLDYVGLPVKSLWISSLIIAMVNIFLAIVTGLSSYRLYHYDEASTNPY